MNRPTRLLEDAKQFTLPDNPGMYEAPEHPIPSLMDGDVVILPPAKLPLPLGGQGPALGQNGEDEWEIAATKILIPRWAAECIQKRLVYGQELRQGESLKARVETIIQTPGEMGKWKRIVKWGLAIVRQMDLEMAKKWSGGLVELLDTNIESGMPGLLHFAFSKGWAAYISLVYWDSWSQASWDLASTKPFEEWSDSDRERAARLLTEGKSFWNYTWMPWEYPLEEVPPCPDLPLYEGPFHSEPYDDPYYCKDVLRAEDSLHLVLQGLQALQSGERWDRERILLKFLPHWAFIHTLAVAESEKLKGILREEFIRAKTGAELENVKSQLAELKNDLLQAKEHKTNEIQNRQVAELLERIIQQLEHLLPKMTEEGKKLIETLLTTKLDELREGLAQNTAATDRNTAATETTGEKADAAFRRGEVEIDNALEDPTKMAARILELANNEMKPPASFLWAEMMRNGYSIRAAARAMKKSESTMTRLFHSTVEPFMRKHGLTLNGSQGHKNLEFNNATEAEIARGGHGHETGEKSVLSGLMDKTL